MSLMKRKEAYHWMQSLLRFRREGVRGQLGRGTPTALQHRTAQDECILFSW